LNLSADLLRNVAAQEDLLTLSEWGAAHGVCLMLMTAGVLQLACLLRSYSRTLVPVIKKEY